MKIYRIAAYDDQGKSIRGLFPYVDDDRVIIPEYPRGHILIDTPTFAACSYRQQSNDADLAYYFFVDGPVRKRWDQLSDDHRIIFRGISVYGHFRFRGIKFRYRDNQYYIFEEILDALENL